MKKIFIVLSLCFFITFLASCNGERIGNVNNTYDISRRKAETINNEAVVIEKKLNEKKESEDIKEENIEIDNIIEEVDRQVPAQKTVESIGSVEEPEINIEENAIVSDKIIDDKAIKKLIATGSTDFNPNQIERSSNIRLAASFINGLVLQPGDEFSFNKIVGQRTKERGFLPADIFVGQSIAKGYGGGVCQTSSTVCIAVRKTSMKILEQNPHSQRVTYTTIDNEAMINYGTSDFRFVNTYESPVAIEILFEKNADREVITCNIYLLE